MFQGWISVLCVLCVSESYVFFVSFCQVRGSKQYQDAARSDTLIFDEGIL